MGTIQFDSEVTHLYIFHLVVRDESAPRMIDNAEAVKPVTWDESATEQINDPSAKQPEVIIYEKNILTLKSLVYWPLGGCVYIS